VLIGSSNDDLRREREVVSAFCARRVDGLIVVPVGGNHRYLQAQLTAGTKVVCVDRPADNLDVDTVIVDNRNGAHQAVTHLLSHGHRRIGYLGDHRNIWTLQERYAGFCDAFGDLGLNPDPALVKHGLRTAEDAARVAAELMRSHQPPTAIFATNDLITIGAISGLGEDAGEVAVVGFDDFALAERLNPPVTVVAQDPVALGATTAQLLFARIAGDTSPPRKVVLLTRLIVRGSGELAPQPA
jgi:LacI family transcriptional regulator